MITRAFHCKSETEDKIWVISYGSEGKWVSGVVVQFSPTGKSLVKQELKPCDPIERIRGKLDKGYIEVTKEGEVKDDRFYFYNSPIPPIAPQTKTNPLARMKRRSGSVCFMMS